MSTVGPDLDYKLRCLEKENDRLLESIRHSRQNALALIAGVFLVVSTTLLSIGEPRINDLKNAQYEEVVQGYLMGKPQSEERVHAVQRLALLWDAASTVTLICAGLTIWLTILVVKRSGKFGPTKATLESVTEEKTETDDKYKKLLMDEFEALELLNDSSRRLLIWAFRSGLAMMIACFAVTLLWIWFGIEAKP